MMPLSDDDRARLTTLRAEVEAERQAAMQALVPDVEIEITGATSRPALGRVAALAARVEAWRDKPGPRLPEDFDRVLAEIDKTLDNRASEPVKPTGPRRLADLIVDTTPRLLRRARGDERPIPVPWPSVASMLGCGLLPGMHVIVGGTGTGKTGLGMQIGLGAARAGASVVYVALELGDVDMVTRAVALSEAGLHAGIFAGELAQGRCDEARASEVLRVAGDELASLPFYVLTGDPYVWRPDERLRETIVRLSGGPYPVLVVIDFLQLVGGDERRDVRERIARAAYAMRDMARDCNAALLIVSSVARSAEREYLAPWGRAWPEPGPCRLAELVGLGKESGEIEFGADSVVVIAETAEDPGEPRRGGGWRRFRVGAPKVRNGAPGRETTLLFNGVRWAEDDRREAEAARRRADLGPKVKAARSGGSRGADRATAEERDPWSV